MVTNLPSMQETRARSLHQEDPGEGHGKPLQCSGLENLWTEEPGGLQSMGVAKSQTQLSEEFIFT